MDMMARFAFIVSCASAVLASAHAECGIANARPFSVAMPGAPESWEKTAVAELKAYLGKSALDGKVTVEGCDAVVFHVGDTDFAKSKGLGSDAFADEEWCIRSFGRDVVLNGGGTRGALYAVFRFLEDDCGIRWWMDGDEDVPAARPLKFAKLDRRGKPFFAVRDIYRDSPADFRTAAAASSDAAAITATAAIPIRRRVRPPSISRSIPSGIRSARGSASADSTRGSSASRTRKCRRRSRTACASPSPKTRRKRRRRARRRRASTIFR